MNVQETIRARMNEFTAAEAAFAEYVLLHGDLIFKSITLVTEESGISYGTVIRFCQKLGFSGFQDFKIHLAVESGRGSAEGGDSEPGWLERRSKIAAQQIAATARAIGEADLKAVTQALAKARFILIVGVAGSFPVAVELAYRMDRLGLLARAECDTHVQAIRASLLGPEDMLFAISNSGSTKEILDCARLARRRGARVVALTNFAKSPLTEESDFVLTTAVWEGVLQAELGTKLPCFFVVELLASVLLGTMPGAEQNLRLSSDSVASRLL